MHSETKVAVHAFNATISATERCWLVSMPGLIQAAFFKRSDESWASCPQFVPTFELMKRPGRDNSGKLQWLFSLISNATRKRIVEGFLKSLYGSLA